MSFISSMSFMKPTTLAILTTLTTLAICYTNFMNSYRDLEVYKIAQELDEAIFELTNKFPKNELYSLSDQIRRSTHSITANIAEGFGRKFYKQEYMRFLTFSRASCHESREHLKTSFKRSYCSEDEFYLLDDKFDHLGKMLTLLIRKIKLSI